MTVSLAPAPVFQGVGFGGLPLPGGKLFTYVAGTNTPQATYTDSTQLTQNTNPTILNANGQANVWFVIGQTYKVILQDFFGNQIYSVDNISSGGITIIPSQLAALLYPATAAELAVPVTFANQLIPYQYVARYETNSVPGTTDMLQGFQNAIDSATADNPTVRFSNFNVISAPLLLRTSTQEAISIVGGARVAAALGPKTTDIHSVAQGINCLIFNQNNNTHLHLRHTEFTDSGLGFTGVVLYTLEGGGTDSSGQCLFSSVFQDIWMGMTVLATGFLKGGMQNCKVDTFEIENCTTAVYNFQGVGCSDIFLSNHTMQSCYDQFISQVTDSNGTTQLTVNGLNAVNHLRGPLFNVQNWTDCKITNVSLEAGIAGNLGSVGLGVFTACTDVEFTNFSAIQRGGTAAPNTVFAFSGCSSFKLSKGQVNGDIGVQIGGAQPIDIDIEDVDFTTFSTACLAVINSGATGTLRTRNCKFNNSQLSCVIHQSVANFNWISSNDEFLNAGLGASSTSRNLNLAPGVSSTITMFNPRIGQTSASAAAAYYVECDGSGTLNIINPIWVGTPPTGYLTGSNTANCNISVTPGYRGSISSAPAITLPIDGDSVSVAGVTTINSITASAYNFVGRQITLIFLASLTVTSGSNLKLNGNYTTAANTTLTLVYDGTNWNEISRG